MLENIKLFSTDNNRLSYEDSEDYIEPYVSYVEGDNSVHYNKPKFFCKLTLSDNSVIELEGSGELTIAMVSQYRQTLVGAEIGELCTSIVAAFYNCTSLTSVTIPNSVTSIGTSAFFGCSSLRSVTIPDSVTSIGISAFGNCTSLTSVTIPNSVTSIDVSAFNGCSGLTSVTIPNSVTSIGGGVFANCSGLTSVTIPSSVTSIGNGTFQNCYNLTSITSLATTAPTIRSNTFRDVKTSGTLTVPQGSTGYDTWMGTGDYYLGKYGWTKIEQQ